MFREHAELTSLLNSQPVKYRYIYILQQELSGLALYFQQRIRVPLMTQSPVYRHADFVDLKTQQTVQQTCTHHILDQGSYRSSTVKFLDFSPTLQVMQ